MCLKYAAILRETNDYFQVKKSLMITVCQPSFKKRSHQFLLQSFFKGAEFRSVTARTSAKARGLPLISQSSRILRYFLDFANGDNRPGGGHSRPVTSDDRGAASVRSNYGPSLICWSRATYSRKREDDREWRGVLRNPQTSERGADSAATETTLKRRSKNGRTREVRR